MKNLPGVVASIDVTKGCRCNLSRPTTTVITTATTGTTTTATYYMFVE